MGGGRGFQVCIASHSPSALVVVVPLFCSPPAPCLLRSALFTQLFLAVVAAAVAIVARTAIPPKPKKESS